METFVTGCKQVLKDINWGPNRYPDMPIDIPNYFNMHGYFKSESMTTHT